MSREEVLRRKLVEARMERKRKLDHLYVEITRVWMEYEVKVSQARDEHGART